MLMYFAVNEALLAHWRKSTPSMCPNWKVRMCTLAGVLCVTERLTLIERLLPLLRRWDVHIVYQTRARRLYPICKCREVGWKRRRSRGFFSFKPTSRCLEIGWNTITSVWYTACQIWKIQSKSSPNAIIVEVTFPNLPLLLSLKVFF